MSESPLLQRFVFVPTEDGSPSLRFAGSDESLSEAMHSLKGAFSETAYIYGTAVEKTLHEGLSLEFLSLGLGLGYNEILTAALVERERPHQRLERLESFEADPDLIAYFTAWIRGESLPAQFQEVYDGILKRAAEHAGVEIARVKQRLGESLATGALRLRGPMDSHTEVDTRFSCFLFDAFSSKTTPELWQEDFLKDFLERAARPHAVFSTYACTGGLKRALKSVGFTLQIREGFSSKRDSTFAIR